MIAVTGVVGMAGVRDMLGRVVRGLVTRVLVAAVIKVVTVSVWRAFVTMMLVAGTRRFRADARR